MNDSVPVVVVEASPLPPAPDAVEIQAATEETLAEAAVEIAEIQADRDVQVAAIEADNDEDMLWLRNELAASGQRHAQHETALAAHQEAIDRLESILAETREALAILISQPTQPPLSPAEANPTPPDEPADGPRANPEESLPPPAPEAASRARQRVWI